MLKFQNLGAVVAKWAAAAQKPTAGAGRSPVTALWLHAKPRWLPLALAIICCWLAGRTGARFENPLLAEDGDSTMRGEISVTAEAMEIHRRAIVIDGHNDLPWKVREEGGSSFDNLDIANDQPSLNTDIPRLKQGGLGAQFWAAYAPSDPAARQTSAHDVMEQIDLIHQMVKRYPETFEFATTRADIERIRRQGKIACLIGVEGGHAIENSLGLLRIYHSLGVRYMTLTHADTLDWADAATDAPKSDGLSPFGVEVVRAMNRLGMMVDISHVSVATMNDALDVTRAPIIASHSSAYAVAEHARNIPDDVLLRIRDNRGLVMVNFFSGFVVPESARNMADMFNVWREMKAKYPIKEELDQAMDAWRSEHPLIQGSIHDVLDHIDHIAKVAGVDHVGLGSDFDGVIKLPRQLEDVSTYPNITQGLLDRGYTEEAIHKILGGNMLRVLEEVEQAAKQ